VRQNLPTKKKLLFDKKIEEFRAKSLARRPSLEKLAYLMDMNSIQENCHLSYIDLKKEFDQLEKSSEFQIFQKNIEHLSHMMRTSLPDKKRGPESGEGIYRALSTQIFPSKLVSLTFSNRPTEITSIKILEEMRKRNIRVDAKIYRLPAGLGIHAPLAQVSLPKKELIHILWNIDSLDWIPQTPARIVKRTTKLIEMAPLQGDIVFL
jgi:hypothetical protein